MRVYFVPLLLLRHAFSISIEGSYVARLSLFSDIIKTF